MAFDTIYAEGQRRYVESLSAYARQFLGLMEKPAVDYIDGLSPAIAIDQKSTSNNPRSTVGTVTEIYDYMRLLWARAGRPYCLDCGRPVTRQTVQQIVDAVLEYPAGTRLLVLAPIARAKRGEHVAILEEARVAGFVRVRIDGDVFDLDDQIKLNKNKRHDIDIVIDRLIVPDNNKNADANLRLAESVETGLSVGQGVINVAISLDIDGSDDHDGKGDRSERVFSEHFACPYDAFSFEEIEPRTFSFNSPHGACKRCTGLGVEMQVDPALVIPDRTLSLADGAIEPYTHASTSGMWYNRFFESLAEEYNFSVGTPVSELTETQLNYVLYGTGTKRLDVRYNTNKGQSRLYKSRFEGVINNLQRRYRDTDSEHRRTQIAHYMAAVACPDCLGQRLRPEALKVLIGDKNIDLVAQLSVAEALAWFESLSGETTLLNDREQVIGKQILKEICDRLKFLVDVGLDYLTLSRSAGSLSGGEAQRIRLATQIGSALMGVLYICDEPSIGLHPVDGDRLIRTLERLRDLGNTVIIVEHDEATMRAADHIIDLGPLAGVAGGKIVAQGSIEDILTNSDSITGAYLSGRRVIPTPKTRRLGNGQSLLVRGARANNLKDLEVEFPLGLLILVTGVSGSGKSSLVNEILVRRAAQVIHKSHQRPGDHDTIEGLHYLDKVVNIDQSPIGRTPRSNPATYTGVFTLIRDLFSLVPESRVRGYKPGRFSFNVKGGRCEECRGDGYKLVEMQFLPDVTVPCEVCEGSRYNREALEIKFRGKTIAEVLDMTVDEALSLFEAFPRVKRVLQTLVDTGLGYIRLGQPSTTLSGGEAQRIKLASELSRRSTGKTLYVLDEPTTGLSFLDVHHLLDVLHRLVDGGNTVVVIEHHLDVIKSADHIIDLGPYGGDRGGLIVAQGSPEKIVTVKKSATGQYLKPFLT